MIEETNTKKDGIAIGDLVRHFLTEQVGIVLDIDRLAGHWDQLYVLWTTQGQSLFGPGSKEWLSSQSVDEV